MSELIASELRIGNKLECAGTTRTVAGVQNGQIFWKESESPADEKEASPIRVSADLLEDAGFTFYENYNYYTRRNIYIKMIGNDTFHAGFEMERGHLVRIRTVNYVHQFQNFCFQVMGEEVNISKGH